MTRKAKPSAPGQQARQPDLPTIAACEKAFDWKAAAWAGCCGTIAKLLNEEFRLGGMLVRGHYVGCIAGASYFAERAHIGFVQHTWIELRDQIIDPTRWAFTGEKPYIFVGPNDHPDYDPCGDLLRQQEYDGRPFPDDAADEHWSELELGTAGQAFLAEMTGRPLLSFNRVQLHWLANLSLKTLGPHARELYEALNRIGKAALIPLDNRRAIAPHTLAKELR